jgi:hypothetical protein
MANVIAASGTPALQRDLWRRGLYAGLVASSFNAGLYVLGHIFGILPTLKVFDSDAVQPGMAAVIVLSLVGALAATAFYRALVRHLLHPMRTFLPVLALVFALSFIAPTAMAVWSRDQVLLFELMHIVVATAVVSGLWDWQRRARSERARLSPTSTE